jgi:phytoene synthase
MDEIVSESKRRIELGSKSFSSAARLFSRDTRHDAYMLYAWCRYCDDRIDGQDFGFRSVAAAEDCAHACLSELRDKTRRALRGDAHEPVFQALARVVHKHDIPERHPFELLDGFAMDVGERFYATETDTLEYCYHVAGVVGVMMAMIMGVRDPATLIRACDLGLGFQLTNIARDVVEDAEAGRIYLPDNWLAEAGLKREQIADPAHRAKVYEVIERLLGLADRYYASAQEGIARLPLRSAWTIAAAARVYRGIGQEIQSRGARAWDRRVVTSRSRKLGSLTLGGLDAIRALALAPVSKSRPREGLWTKPELAQSI